MAGKKVFIGYDLGDGETITDLAVLSDQEVADRVQTTFDKMTMPDCNDGGKAIPSVFGFDEDGQIVFTSSILNAPETIRDIRINFKRRPSDLLPELSKERQEEILELVGQGWPDRTVCPELYSPEMLHFQDAVIRFTNAIFLDRAYENRVRSAAVDADQVVFCVGHPTKWSELDVAVYAALLRCSVLGEGSYVGLPSVMLMAAESRAAFLYVRDKATSKVLRKDTCALLIDVGSSTIDLTAMTSDSRNHQYNSGSNYLGARSIDFAIRQWYLDKLRQDDEDWQVYLDLLRENPAMDQALTLSCRLAKETVYSTKAGTARINFADFRPIRMSKADLDKLIDQMPISWILRSFTDLPDEEAADMGEKTWKQLFEEFLISRKEEMEQQGITLSRIIMTGSASKMPFVAEIVAKVFQEIPAESILADMDPSRSISMGLALVGPSNEKSKKFQQDLVTMLDEELPKLISEDIPQLAKDLSGILSKKINKIVTSRMAQWRSMKIDTLEEMTGKIQQDCSAEKLNAMLTSDQAYNNAIERWAVDVVGQDIALKLHSLCDRYGVGDISVDSLNVMKVNALELGDINIDPSEELAELISGAVAIIAGIVTAVMLPTILGVVIGLISYISAGLAFLLLDILLALPGVGWAILIGVAGIAVVNAASKGMGGAKQMLTEKIQKINLPKWVRDLMTDEKLEKQMAKANLDQKIQESLLTDEARAQMVDSVSKGLGKQIRQRAEDIKYVIESN